MVIFFGHFLMVGKGNKLKSMAYVGNIVAFVKFYDRECDGGCKYSIASLSYLN